MQITSATTIPFVPVSFGTSATKSTVSSDDSDQAASSTSEQAALSNSDQAALNMTSATFSSLVQEAKAYPEVRSEVVSAYATQVASGHYPPTDVLSGLADLLSSGLTD